MPHLPLEHGRATSGRIDIAEIGGDVGLFVERLGLKRALPWFVLLLLSIVPLWALNNAALNYYPLLIRGLFGGLINALPIGISGIIVSILISRSANPTASNFS